MGLQRKQNNLRKAQARFDKVSRRSKQFEIDFRREQNRRLKDSESKSKNRLNRQENRLNDKHDKYKQKKKKRRPKNKQTKLTVEQAL